MSCIQPFLNSVAFAEIIGKVSNASCIRTHYVMPPSGSDNHTDRAPLEFKQTYRAPFASRLDDHA